MYPLTSLVFVVSALSLGATAQASTAHLDGNALFSANCAVCHGDSGKGGQGDVKGPPLAGDASTWPLKIFQRAVLQGIDDHGKLMDKTMPHWKDASFQSDKGKPPTPLEVAAIQRYLKAVK
ncbi:MAG: cytochrome c [Rhodoferax sp.]|uniref:c-type cytochrome n=1 Tax=Rhodoferax sp. TaxID=50421 RepID=UPI0032670AA7